MPSRAAKIHSRHPLVRACLTTLASTPLFALPLLHAADTEIDVLASATDLTIAGSYTPANTPSALYDVTFTAGTTYANPLAFTINSNIAFGSLNDLNATALAISNTGAAAVTLTLGGTGDVVTGSNTADLLYVAAAGNLTINGGTGNTALNIALAQSGNFDVAGTANITSAISGAYVLTKTGNGTLTLGGASTYSGGTALSAGTLKLGSSTVGTAGTVGSNGALTSGPLGTGSFNITGGFVGFDLNGQTFGTRWVNSANNNTIKNTSSNTAYVTGAMDGGLNGGVISDFTVGNDNGGNIIWTGQLSRTNFGNFNFTKTGNDTVIFQGTTANNGVGTVTVNAGTLGLGMTGTSAGTFADSATVTGTGTLQFRPDLGTVAGGSNFGGQLNSTLTVNGGTVDLFGSSGQNSRVQQLIGTGGTITNTSATAATLGIAARDNNTTREYDGLIKDGAGTVALDFTGTGTTGSGRINYLTGPNTYSGGTAISFGTVRLGSSSALGTGLVTVTNANLDLFGQSFANALATGGNGAVITNSSATTATVSNGFNQGGAGGFVISDFTVNGTGNINWSGAIRRTNGNGGFTKAGSNTLTLTGVGTGYSNLSYSVNLGTLAFNMPNNSTFTGYGNFNNSVNGIAVASGANVAGAETTGITNTVAAVINGAGTFTQTGAGTTILTAANTFTGGTTVSAGVLQLNYTNNGTGTLTGTLTITGGTVKTNAADVLGYNGGSGTTSTINVNAGGTFDNAVAGNNGYITTFNLTGGSVTATGGGSINFAPSATVTLNSLASPTTSVFSAPITLRNGTALVITTAQGTTASGVDMNISGAIGQNNTTGAIDKEGAGTLLLSSTSNNYTGTTNVGAGRLLVNGGITGTGAVTVVSGATLGGAGDGTTTGLIAGPATINGTVAPGTAAATIGQLTLTSTAGATIGASGIYLVDIGGNASDNLRLSAGALTITSGATLTFNTLSTLTAPSYALANYTSEMGMFAVTNLPSGYMLSYGATELDLISTTPVPEPATWAAGLLCLGTLGYRLRRRLGGRAAGRQTA